MGSFYDTGFVIALTDVGVALPVPKGSKAPAAIRFVGAAVAYDADALVLGDGTRIAGAVVTLGPPVPAFDDLPEAVGTASAPGTSASYAHGDHSHAHGELPGGSLHAEASVDPDSAGFMSSVDKYKLNTIEAYADVTITALAAAASDVSVNGQKITNLASPAASTDAASKGYVDGAAANISATAGQILKATSATTGGDSLMSEAGSVVTINGKLVITGELEMISASGGGWTDLEGPVNIITVGPTVPVITALPAPYAGFSKPLWQIDDTWQAEFHIPHGVDPTAGIFLHVHALIGGTQTRDLKIEFTYSIGKGYKRGVLTVPATLSGTQAAPGVAMEYMILEVGPILAGSSDYETDSILTVRFTRRTNGGTELTDSVFIDRCDCHIRMLAPHVSVGRNYPFSVAP